MPLFTVMRRGEPPVTIDAPNWIVAMGNGIQALGGDVAIDRLACEMLPNGTVIARDVRSGIGYVVLPSGAPPSPPPVAEDTEDQIFEGEDDDDSVSVEQTLDDGLERTLDLAEDDEDTPDIEQDAVLMEALGRIAGAANAAGAWELSLDAAMRSIESEAGAAVEATPHAGLLFIAVAGEMANKLRAMRLPYGKGFVGFCVDHAMALTVADVHRDDRHYGAVDQATGFETRAVVVVPVASSSEVFGCLELLNPPEGRLGRIDVLKLERVATELAARLVHSGVRGRTRPG
ncbi:MAG: GAF domain-containing protein [Proteobacteria bacterium]|nr:GAF domain-containing protein [Pseudomonadota bacterium]MCP4921400.1 GAF domain-containing protein [Pseudomonadota bacterium]